MVMVIFCPVLGWHHGHFCILRESGPAYPLALRLVYPLSYCPLTAVSQMLTALTSEGGSIQNGMKKFKYEQRLCVRKDKKRQAQS